MQPRSARSKAQFALDSTLHGVVRKTEVRKTDVRIDSVLSEIMKSRVKRARFRGDCRNARGGNY